MLFTFRKKTWKYRAETSTAITMTFIALGDTIVVGENPQYSRDRFKESSPGVLTICIEKKGQTVSDKFFYGQNIRGRPIFKERDDINLTSSIIDEIRKENLRTYIEAKEKVVWQGVDISDLSGEEKEFFMKFVGALDVGENFTKEDLHVLEEELYGNFED